MRGRRAWRPVSPAVLVEVLRIVYGMVQLVAPARVARVVGGRLDHRARVVARVLGARHVVQGCVSAAAPDAVVLALGAEVDLLHAASMVALAVVDRRRRRIALADACVAASFTGLVSSPGAPRSRHARPGTITERRRVGSAASGARRLAPPGDPPCSAGHATPGPDRRTSSGVTRCCCWA